MLSIVCGLLALMFLLVNWDPTRVWYKRWLADDPYRYDEIDPEYRAVDPASSIHIRSMADVRRVRAGLTAVIWPGGGGLPLQQRPERIESIYPTGANGIAAATCDPAAGRTELDVACALDRYAGMDNLERIEQLHIPVAGFVAIVSLFHPKAGNGRLIVYQNGFASTINRQFRHIQAWLEQGFAVLAFNLPGYGNYGGDLPPFDDAPLRMFVEPVVVGINDALGRFGYGSADMVGFSAGGWVAALVAAVDTRVRRSYLVAASLPVYLRRERETASPQLRRELLDAAGYLDIYVLGATGAGRRQVQIFNRYDTCCFAGPRALLYERAVQEAVAAVGSGEFDVVLDETHPRHKISKFAMDVIRSDMARP